MGCNSSKYSSSGKHNKGTTIVACHVNGSIVFGVDSRSSNETLQGVERDPNKKPREWHLTITDDWDKVFRMSSNIVAVMAGSGRDCIKMCKTVKDEAGSQQLSVSYVYEEMIRYLEGPNGENKEFGTIIAGWDKAKGLQLCRMFIADNRIVKDRSCAYASLGSGRKYANEYMESRYVLLRNLVYHYDMRIEDAVDMVLKALFYATLYDKCSGGVLQVYQVNEKGCHKISTHKSLEAYRRCYEPDQERNTLFLVCSSKQQPFTADDLITCFYRKYGRLAMAGHRVAHCVTKKQSDDVAFYFHRLVYSQNEASKVYSQIVAENGEKARPRDLTVPEIYKKFDYRVELNTLVHGRDVKVPVYVSWSSKDLLEEMFSTCRIK